MPKKTKNWIELIWKKCPVSTRDDKRGHFAYYLSFVTWPSLEFLLTLLPSSCPCNYWIPPKTDKKHLSWHITHLQCTVLHPKALLTAEDIWFKCGLYLRFIPPINLWKIWIDLRPFSKCFRVPFSRTLRSPRSNNLEIQNDENSKWKLVKIRWNSKFGLGDLKNDFLGKAVIQRNVWKQNRATS